MDHKLIIAFAFVCFCIVSYYELFVNSCAMDPLVYARIESEMLIAKRKCDEQQEAICAPQKTRCAAGLVSTSTEILGKTITADKCVLISEYDLNASYPCEQKYFHREFNHGSFQHWTETGWKCKCGNFSIEGGFDRGTFDCYMDATLDYPRHECTFKYSECIEKHTSSCVRVERYLETSNPESCTNEVDECRRHKEFVVCGTLGLTAGVISITI